jgi:hypothetical protein
MDLYRNGTYVPDASVRQAFARREGGGLPYSLRVGFGADRVNGTTVLIRIGLVVKPDAILDVHS